MGHRADATFTFLFTDIEGSTRLLTAHGEVYPSILPRHRELIALRVRMGLHTGSAARVDGGLVGLDVNRGARVVSAAHGGQILVSHTTAALVQSDLPPEITLRDLGPHRL